MSEPRLDARARGLAQPLFLLLIAAAAAFILISSASLPSQVASHFDAAGVPNGFMSRAAYQRIMLVLVVAVASMIGWLPAVALRRPDARINLPHREYWLAPQRRAATIELLLGRMRSFAGGVLLFLCYAHELVVRANRSSPARLSARAIEWGVVLFLAATFIWTLRLTRRFRRID